MFIDRILSDGFMKPGLLVSYACFIVSLVAYLALSLGELVIELGAMPGAIFFVLTWCAYGYRMGLAFQGELLSRMM